MQVLLQVLLKIFTLGNESTHWDTLQGGLCSQSFLGQPLAQVDLEKPQQVPNPEQPPGCTGMWELSVPVPGVYVS